MTHKLKKALFIAACISAVWLFVYEVGPLDTLPRTDQLVVSPDGAWRVTIYRYKTTPLNPFASTQMMVKVENAQGRKLCEDKLWMFGARANWNTYSGRQDIYVTFESEGIVITRRPYRDHNHSGWIHTIRKERLV